MWGEKMEALTGWEKKEGSMRMGEDEDEEREGEDQERERKDSYSL